MFFLILYFQTCLREIDSEDCISQIKLLASEIVGPFGLQVWSKLTTN